jgi:hypothetical protein
MLLYVCDIGRVQQRFGVFEVICGRSSNSTQLAVIYLMNIPYIKTQPQKHVRSDFSPIFASSKVILRPVSHAIQKAPSPPGV